MLFLQRIVSPCNPLDWLTGACYFTTRIINTKSLHIITFLAPSWCSCQRVILRHPPLVMAQQKRGFQVALSKIESLLEVVKTITPIGNPNWEKILNKHTSCYTTKDCTAKLLCWVRCRHCSNYKAWGASGNYKARGASGDYEARGASGRKYKAQMVIFCILAAVNRFSQISRKE